MHSKILNIEFGWQARYHDHIIRSHDEFIRISNYILSNPCNWKDDKFLNCPTYSNCRDAMHRVSTEDESQ